jgi:hypothetical protein
MTQVMKKITPTILLFTLLVPLNAEEDKMKFDKLLDYTNVTVTKIEPDGIRIIHESGAVKIPYENIPEETRVKLGMNQEAADSHRKNVQVQEQRITAAIKKQQVLDQARFTFVGSVLQVTDGGLLLIGKGYTDGTKEKKKISHMKWPIFVECNTSGRVDGDRFSGHIYRNGTFAYTNTQGARMTIPAYTTDPSKVLELAGLGDKRDEPQK